MGIEQIKADILQLSVEERANLVRELLASLNEMSEFDGQGLVTTFRESE